jgi:hypothetical protein
MSSELDQRRTDISKMLSEESTKQKNTGKVATEITAVSDIKSFLDKRVVAIGNIFSVIYIVFDRELGKYIITSYDENVKVLINGIAKFDYKKALGTRKRFNVKTIVMEDVESKEVERSVYVEDLYKKEKSTFFSATDKNINLLKKYADILEMITRYGNIELSRV